MAAPSIKPFLVVADSEGNIYDHPDLLMVCRQGNSFSLPKPDELIPLPEGSELFMLPARKAIGLDEETGQIEPQEDMAVAAFISPAYTLTGHAAYISNSDAPTLPLFAYGAVGFANNRFYVCAKKVDDDKRQVFTGISDASITQAAKKLMQKYPDNRLMQHLMQNCVLTYACPAARNLALGRFEAPLPTSRACNARCVGCISWQEENSPITATPQCRLSFTPTPEEIVEVMLMHSKREVTSPIYSFGQGCEGEPLTEVDTLEKAIILFKSQNGPGTINLNTNASNPKAVERLAKAGLSSMRVSLNSAKEATYNTYYRPVNYTFSDVRQSISVAKENGVFVSLNLLYFPGINDTEEELAAIVKLVNDFEVDFIQLRNLNIDPEMYLSLLSGLTFGPVMGFNNFKKRLTKSCPSIKFGYFNPFVTE